MTKPSEIIKEIQNKKCTYYNDGQYTEYPLELAVMDYLDEEYEKNKPCTRFEGNTQWCDKCGEASISH